MSKYEEAFVTMKSCIFFLIAIFVQLVICSEQTNLSDYEAHSVCPVSYFRRKRGLIDYTRWRASYESTPEFIVKVLDEDVVTPNTKQIVAVNIQPIAKRGEKIIIGGAIVPPPTTAVSTMTEMREYTRFVPPTTLPVANLKDSVLPVPTPVIPIKMPVIAPKEYAAVRHLQRDESPPASPQFLARASSHVARQYAPIAAVAFTKRITTAMPLTPPILESPKPYRTPLLLTRTEPLSDIITPTRTIQRYQEFSTLQLFEDDENADVVIATRSTFVQKKIPQRTTTAMLATDEDFIPTRTEPYEYVKKSIIEDKIEDKVKDKSLQKYSDDSYNMMFYNEDDMETSTKKILDDFGDVYDDKTNTEEKSALSKKELPKGSTETEMENFNELENKVEVEIPVYDDIYAKENDVYADNGHINIRRRTDDKEAVTVQTLKDRIKTMRRPVCNLLKLKKLNFNSPLTLHEIVSQLKQWADNSPVAKWLDITDGNYTTMENPIYMMIVDDLSSGQIVSAKHTVMIVAGIQGRDHHAVAAAMYILHQLIERSDAHTDLLTKFRFWIIPVFNPDGYDYSMTFPHRREWSKNLRQGWEMCKGQESCKACESYGLRCTIQPCYGVNLDRNFEYQWIPTEELHSEYPCGQLYAGSRQLSEAETRAFTHFMHEQHVPLFSFIALKEGDVLGILYPYSHTKKLRAVDSIYRQRANRAAAAANSIGGRPYVAGQTSEFLPLYAGGIEDWVDGHLGIDNTYTIMMFRPTDSYNLKLIRERVVHEAFAAMDTLLLQSITEAPAAPRETLVTILRSECTACSASHIVTLLHIVMGYICS